MLQVIENEVWIGDEMIGRLRPFVDSSRWAISPAYHCDTTVFRSQSAAIDRLVQYADRVGIHLAAAAA